MKKNINLCFLILLFTKSCAQSNRNSINDNIGDQNGSKLNIFDQEWKKKIHARSIIYFERKSLKKTIFLMHLL
jgi:hypothetical protein